MIIAILLFVFNRRPLPSLLPPQLPSSFLFLNYYLFYITLIYTSHTSCREEEEERTRICRSESVAGGDPSPEMEVVIPTSSSDFNFDSTCSSPYISAPSTPRRFGDNSYFSAPTSPTRAAALYSEFRRLSIEPPTPAVPFGWEEKPGTPKSAAGDHDKVDAGNDCGDDDDSHDFAFDFSGQLDKPDLTAAEELFEQGRIRPMNPPPRFDSLPKSPKSPRYSPRRIFRQAFSPRRKKKVGDPFAAAVEESRQVPEYRERGRQRAPASDSRRAARSLSPYRVSDMVWDDSVQAAKPVSKADPTPPPPGSLKATSKKWSFKDFLLFRSASEGRATTGKDPLRKYTMITKAVKAEDVKNSSFRSIDSSVSGSSRHWRRGPVSAHELHYTANRAVSEELRRKTFLPYKQGLLACLRFNPAVQGLAKGFPSITRTGRD